MGGSLALWTIAAVACALAALGVLVLSRLRDYRRGEEAGNDPEDGFSLARYEPMARLLGPEDLRFLRSLPVRGQELAAGWERTRRRIFRKYLRDLAWDFQRFHADARALVAESPEQYSGLVDMLVRQQFTFWRAMAGIELRLALSGLGIAPVDARRLVAAIEAMRAEIAQAAAPVSA